MKKKVTAILRTKGDILIARDLNNIKIHEDVLSNWEFKTGKMTDLFGFKMMEGSDPIIIEAKSVERDQDAFFNFAFGEKQDD